MKKYYILIVVLCLIIIGEVVVIFLNSNQEVKPEDSNIHIPKEEENVNVDDSVTLKETRVENDSIIQEYSVVLNGKENMLIMRYNFEPPIEENGNYEIIRGSFNTNTLYYKEEPINSNLYNDFNVERINNSFNEDNFRLIKGSDNKNYLLVIVYNFYSRYLNNGVDLYIFNDDLELVHGELNNYTGCESSVMTIKSGVTSLILEDDTSPWYTDVYQICDSEDNCQINVKIENNQIYYLMPVLDYHLENGYGLLEERVYTINNNELEYEVINTYTIVNGYGQIC